MAQKKKSISHLPFVQSFLYVLVSIVLTFILVQIPAFHTFIASFGELGYLGAVVAGVLFVSVFTAAPAMLLLFTLAETHPALPLAVAAGIGAVIGDYLIFSTITHHAQVTIDFLSDQKGIMKTIRLLRHSKYRFFLTVLGAIIIASPLPDEIGLSLMGLTNMKKSTFIFLTFFLNTIGIYVLLLAIG